MLLGVETYDHICAELARRDFYEYRKFINSPTILDSIDQMLMRAEEDDLDLDDLDTSSLFSSETFIEGWFVEDLCKNLQEFAEDLVAGKRPKLIINTPPQHGKSVAVIDFLTWFAGKYPNYKQIFASFSKSLGVRANMAIERIMRSPKYAMVFPEQHFFEGRDKHTINNSTKIEFPGFRGSFFNTTVEGAITGEQMDLGVIDDPIKGQKQANSETIRESVWEWFNSEFMTRFSERSGLLIICTRWHVADPVGKLLDTLDPGSVKVLSYEAIATKDEKHRKEGEPLFPEIKSLEFLEERRKSFPQHIWEALYQQSPFIRGGGMFKVENFNIIKAAPDCEFTVRYWDKAGTEGGGARTAGVKMGITKDNKYVILDVVKGQWSPANRNKRMKQTTQMDGFETTVWVEQEPGSGGKESAEITIKDLAGYIVYAERVTGSKEIRAEAYSAQVEIGNVYLVEGPWNKEFIDEHETFPAGEFKDQVDSASGAFNKLVEGDDQFYI